MISDLTQAGWGYHDTQPERLAQELEQLELDGLPSDQAANLLKLANHTLGEHLNNWERACVFSRRVGQMVPMEQQPGALSVQLALAEQMGGDPVQAAQIELAAMVRAATAGDSSAAEPLSTLLELRLAMASALAGCSRTAEAVELYENVLALVPMLGARPPIVRSLAVASNNMANDLLALSNRSAAQQRLMRRCAEVAFANWRLCGTWENEERALYLLQLICHAQGDYAGALNFAERALAIIQAQGPEPIDEGFILLAKSASLWCDQQPDQAAVALRKANALASQWQDADLQAAFQEEKLKRLAETGMLDELREQD